MLGTVLANAGSGLTVAVLLFLAQRVEAVGHSCLGRGPVRCPLGGSGADRPSQCVRAGTAVPLGLVRGGVRARPLASPIGVGP